MITIEHAWNLSPTQARELQRRLAPRIIRKGRTGPVRTVAGLDVANKRTSTRAAVVVLAFPDLDILDQATASLAPSFPYIPGLLSFREGPAILAAYRKLTIKPDLLMFDGQGIAHPRRLGIASHLGLWLDKPAIGCAKSRLCGRQVEPESRKGSYEYLMDDDETIGAVLRTRDNVKPVYVSIGHRLDLHACIAYVLGCCSKYRLPETTRLAHRLAGAGSIQTHR